MKWTSRCLQSGNGFRLVFSFLLLLLLNQNLAIAQTDYWQQPLESLPQRQGYVPGSFRFELYLPLLKNKRVGLVVNHTSQHNGRHLVDTLLASGVQIKKIFAPEHGFRGKAPEGEMVKSETDPKTGLPLISLYGKSKKPSAEMLADVDVVLFDIQDVGARFYTYISTMKLVMEACNENNKRFIVCDRFNPLGYCTGGPVLAKGLESFVGAFPIPTVHGLTVGELAKMVKAQNWIPRAKKLKMNVIPCLGYSHKDTNFPALPPSPNLGTPLAILAYPHLCLFEGTNWSVGRGTPMPFMVFGFPDSTRGSFQFTPFRVDSHQVKPLYNGKICFGTQLTRDSITNCFSLKFLIQAWKQSKGDSTFFNSFFPRLAGTHSVKDWIRRGEEPVFDQTAWLKKRKKFLLYPE